MAKIMQNLVVFMEPSENAFEISLEGGNMILSRFCIDEDAAFELSGVYSLKKLSLDKEVEDSQWLIKFKLKTEEKGKEYSF